MIIDYHYNLSASEQLTQGNFDFIIGDGFHYIQIGDTTVSQLKKAKIIPQKSYNGFTRNKPDGMIIFGKNEIKVLVEYKKPGTFSNAPEAAKLITEWYYNLAKKLECNVICATDGTRTFWFHAQTRKEIVHENGNPILFKLDTSELSDNSESTIYKNNLIHLLSKLGTINSEGIIIAQKAHNPQNLAKNVWQRIWITTGKQPEQCLYNVVEIFLFKYLSDLGVLEDDYSFERIYRKSENNPTDALRYYADNVRKRIKDLFPRSEWDGTTIINGTIFVNEEGNANLSQAVLFKDVLKQFFDYGEEFGSFQQIDKNFKTRLYENFLRRTAGISSMGQFFTPRNVVQSIIGMSRVHNIPDNANVCDPFCGVGGFILEFLNENPNIKAQFIPQDNGHINPKITLTGYDKGTDEKDNQRTIILAKANMLIYLSDIVAKYKQYTANFSSEVFNRVFHLIKSNVGTFGITSDKDKYDLILTNPPYVTSGVGIITDELKELGIKNEIYTTPCKGLEGLAIEWILYSLKEGGTAFIIVPEGVLRRGEDRWLRNLIIDKCTLNAIISLPTRTFFATPQDTYILSITKRHTSQQQPQPYRVFTYLVSEIGETRDSNRFTIPQNDLISASILYRQFIVSRDEFTSTDKRCKILNISNLIDSKWTVKDQWTDEEKTALGIDINQTVISERDFFEILHDLRSEIDAMTIEAATIDITNIRFRSIPLGELGSFERGKSKYTKKYCHEHPGDWPVFSADTKGNRCIGNVDTYDYDFECLTITTNGHYAGTPHYVEKQKFSMNGDCGCFTLNEDFIDTVSYRYLEYALINKRSEHGFNWKNKPTPTDILNLEINIPVDEHGDFDLTQQQRIVDRYTHSYTMKQRLIREMKHLYTLNIDLFR